MSNEYLNENKRSIVRQCINHLEIKPLDAYVKEDTRVIFISNPRYEQSEEEQKRRTEEHKIQQAVEMLKFKKVALKSLFPKIQKDFVVRSADIERMVQYIQKLSEEIRGARHYFGHKYQDVTAAKYEESLKSVDLEKLERITDSLFSIASNIGLIFRDSSYSKSDFGHEPEISDQIDLILFGSIKLAVYTFYEGQDAEAYYWDVREKYFKSDGVLSLINRQAPTT